MYIYIPGAPATSLFLCVTMQACYFGRWRSEIRWRGSLCIYIYIYLFMYTYVYIHIPGAPATLLLVRDCRLCVTTGVLFRAVEQRNSMEGLTLFKHIHIYIYTHTHIHTHMYIYNIYIYLERLFVLLCDNTGVLFRAVEERNSMEGLTL